MFKNDKLLEKEDRIYDMFLKKFKYIVVYVDVYYAILITGCFNYLQL